LRLEAAAPLGLTDTRSAVRPGRPLPTGNPPAPPMMGGPAASAPGTRTVFMPVTARPSAAAIAAPLRRAFLRMRASLVSRWDDPSHRSRLLATAR